MYLYHVVISLCTGCMVDDHFPIDQPLAIKPYQVQAIKDMGGGTQRPTGLCAC